MESNKPDWDDLELWAYFIACDEDGQWYQYEKQPPFSKIYTVDGVHKWNTAEHSKFSACKNVADGEWAKLYWKCSVEARPSSNPQEVVKPDWSTAPDWANWLACDSGAQGHEWWWYAEEPMKSKTNLGSWTNHVMTKCTHSNKYASPEWADANWETSVEQRPEAGDEPTESNPYLTDERKRRITLFIDFDDTIFNDEQLAQNIAEMLCNRLGTSMDYPGNKFTPGGGSVDRIRIAIGKELMNKIAYDPDDGFYIESKEND